MFVIPCKFSQKHNYVIDLTKQIRQFHPKEEIVVVDSDSEDKSYYKELEKNEVIIEDIKNKHYHVGAYWYCYEKYERDFYYFLHDSMVVNQNLDYLKQKELTAFAYFKYNPVGDIAEFHIKKFTKYNVPPTGYCVFGPILFCKKNVMDKLYNANVNKILPTHSQHTLNPPPDGFPAFYAEAVFGVALNQEGYNYQNNTIVGDIVDFMQRNGSALYENSFDKSKYPLMKIFAKRQ